MAPKPSEKSPNSYGDADLGYDPQGSGMDHDSFFREVCPGVADSGTLKHKWDVEGDHWAPEEPPSDLKGD